MYYVQTNVQQYLIVFFPFNSIFFKKKSFFSSPAFKITLTFNFPVHKHLTCLVFSLFQMCQTHCLHFTMHSANIQGVQVLLFSVVRRTVTEISKGLNLKLRLTSVQMWFSLNYLK